MDYSGRLSVIILIHNNVDISKRCFKALAEAVTDFDHEIIVLDNNSSEDTDELRAYGNNFHSFKWIRNRENATFSVGNNIGCRESSGSHLLFLNNDVFLKPNSLIQLISPLIENQDIGATGGKLLYPGEESVQHAGICQMLWDHPSNFGVGAKPSDSRIQDTCERFALSGAMLCTKREVFDRVGGFDERYIWGTEDIDLCLKVRAAGFRTVYFPGAEAIHCESATLKTNDMKSTGYNCRLYRQKWDPLLIPAEQEYVRSLITQGIRRVAVFGTGSAARGLSRILDGNGIQIAAFTASSVPETGSCFLDRPLLPLNLLKREDYDRLFVASQHFFEIEQYLLMHDPERAPIYPVLN